MPFLSVGIFGLIIATALLFVVPDVKSNSGDSLRENGRSLTIKPILRVTFCHKLLILSKVRPDYLNKICDYLHKHFPILVSIDISPVPGQFPYTLWYWYDRVDA